MKQDKIDDLKVMAIKVVQLTMAVGLTFWPLLTYLYLDWLNLGGWSSVPLWKRLTMVTVIGGYPLLCGLAWLKLMWRVRRAIAAMPDGDGQDRDGGET
jgi:hypothetical protein